MKKFSVMLAAVFFAAFMTFSVHAEDLCEISAKSAVVINAQTGEVLFEKNAYEELPMASTTKIMSALIALEQDDLDEKFVVDSEAIRTEGSSMGLQEGDIVSLRDLCCGMLLPSGNDAANAAAVRISGSIENFVELMNERAEEYGLTSTHFVTPSGLDDDTDDHYSTAYDMARLAQIAMENPDFREICGSQQIKLNFGNPPYDRWLINSNKLLKSCEGVVGIKTGFTDKAKRCLVSACDRNGAELICVTLNAPDDWNDHANLYDHCFGFLSEQTLPLETNCFAVNAVGGDKDSIVCSTQTTSAVLLNNRAKDVAVKIYLPQFVYAPVKQGSQVGKVEYYYNGVRIAESPIIAEQTVEYQHCEKPSFFEYYREKLSGLFS